MVTVEAILDIFPDARISGTYARVRCPFHKDGHERRPSMSILLVDKGNAPKGLCHCFTCGKALMFDELAKELGYATTTTLTREPPAQTETTIALATTPTRLKQSMPYRFSPYLASRGIGEAVQRLFRVYEKDGVVHMPVFSREGLFLYDNSRTTIGKRFNVQANARKTLWGIEEIDLSRPIAICESQIDAMSLWQVGLQAVATLGADNISALREIQNATAIFILAFDPDEAGVRARYRAAKLLGKWRCNYIDLPQGVDVNKCLTDIKDEEVFVRYLARITKKIRTIL